jgi:precorrin-6A/cobalt-precorrin-6A reductase
MAGRRRLLVLGGTSEAAALVRALATADRDLDVVTSLAGRTSTLPDLPGTLRVGGFGGIDGLARYLEEAGVAAVVDATHPFAAQMPWHAEAACRAVGRPRLRLLRPAWTPSSDDRWHAVPDLDAAADALRAIGARRVFLTTGRQELAPFARMTDVWFLVRSIEPPAPDELPAGEVVLDRGPFAVDDERALMAGREIDVLVTKNSGAAATHAKLVAARHLGIPVVMVDRPPTPLVPIATTVDEAVAWVDGVLAEPPSRSAGGCRPLR